MPWPWVVEVETAVGQRHGQGRLGLEEQMLDALRRPDAADHVRRLGERRLHVAPGVARDRQDVVVPGVDLRRARLDRLGGVEHRRQRLVFDLDEARRLAGDARTLGGHRRHHVADAAHLFALGDETGPVLVDLADPAVARHVLGGRHRDDAGKRERLGGVDPDDAGARIAGQHDDAVQHAGDVDVGDEGPLAEGELAALVALEPRADAAVLDRRRQGAALLGRLDQFDRVDDLHVSGAAAQMSVEHPRDLRARQLAALVGHPFDAQHQPRRAEAALQPGGDLEGVGVEAALVVGNAFERENGAPFHLRDAHRARHLGNAVDERDTTAALLLRRAARLDGFQLEGFAQHVDQRLVGPGLDAAGFSIETKADGLHDACPARVSVVRMGQGRDPL